MVPMWFIGKTFLSCQILCPFKIQPSWKVFGLLVMCKVPFLPLLMLILKTPLLFHIVVIKTYDPLWKHLLYTPFWDLGLGNFIMVKFENLELYLVWMGRVESEVVKVEHSKFFKHFSYSMVGACEKRNKEW